MVNKIKYTLDLLEEKCVKKIFITLSPTTKISQNEGTSLEDLTSYRILTGRLLYLTDTRPDISFYMQHLIQFIINP